LPQGAVITSLPAFDRFGGGFVAGVWGQTIFEGPSSNAGEVGFEMEAAQEFTGDGTVGARRLGGKEFSDQGGDLWGPRRLMIATGESGRPGLSAVGGAGPEVLAVKFIEAGTAQPQFAGGGAGTDLAVAITVEKMTDERRGQTFDQLLFFIGPR
jgi:hypothetical protein